MLEKEFEYYKLHKAEFGKKYANRFIVIISDKIIGVFNDQHSALSETLKDHNAGTFLIQKCSKKEDQIMRFHSRVSFA